MYWEEQSGGPFITSTLGSRLVPEGMVIIIVNEAIMSIIIESGGRGPFITSTLGSRLVPEGVIIKSMSSVMESGD